MVRTTLIACGLMSMLLLIALGREDLAWVGGWMVVVGTILHVLWLGQMGKIR